MEAEAVKRKARLAALRASKADADAAAAAAAAAAGDGDGGGARKRPHTDAAADGDADAAGAPAGGSGEGEVHLRFRNYTPLDTDLKTHVEPKPVVPTVEEEVKKFARSEQELSRAHEVRNARRRCDRLARQDLLNLAPKKPNWDLKRDLNRQLARVEKKTKRAIAELIRERVLKEKDGQLAAVVAAQKELTAGDESD